MNTHILMNTFIVPHDLFLHGVNIHLTTPLMPCCSQTNRGKGMGEAGVGREVGGEAGGGVREEG